MIASLFFSMACICVLPIPKWSANFLDSRLGFFFANSRTLTFSETSRHLRFFWDVAGHLCFAFAFVVLLPFGVCFAFAFVVLLPFGIADRSSTQGLSFEFVHGMHIDTACRGFHPGSSSEAAREQFFDLLQTGLAHCKHL